jgi:hypothetical protein
MPNYNGPHYWEYPVWIGGTQNRSGYWEGNKMRCKYCGLVIDPKERKRGDKL